MRGPIVALTLLVAACGNTVSSLPYTAAGPVAVAGRPRIAAVAATDQRREAPNRLATIMGGFGNP